MLWLGARARLIRQFCKGCETTAAEEQTRIMLAITFSLPRGLALAFAATFPLISLLHFLNVPDSGILFTASALIYLWNCRQSFTQEFLKLHHFDLLQMPKSHKSCRIWLGCCIRALCREYLPMGASGSIRRATGLASVHLSLSFFHQWSPQAAHYPHSAPKQNYGCLCKKKKKKTLLKVKMLIQLLQQINRNNCRF